MANRRTQSLTIKKFSNGKFDVVSDSLAVEEPLEIQIEFGAVVPIEFGPLKATGRVTAGIYLMSSPGLRVLEGFVRAVGEGNIACFSLSVCLEVTIRQENGGDMIGSSSFSLSFKLGFVKVKYGFTASYAVEGGGSGGGGGGGNSAAQILRLSESLTGEGKKVIATIHSRMPDKRNDWSRYKKSFAI